MRWILNIIGLNILYYKLLIYNNNIIEYQDRINIKDYWIGWDSINISILWLILFISPILWLNIKKNIKLWNSLICGLISLLLIQDLLIYYIFLELIVFPLFYLIIKEGSKYNYYMNRIEASIRLLLYTLFGGILLLLAVIIIRYKYGTTDNELLSYMIENNQWNINIFIYVLLLISFFIKIPVFPFHTWLPLAHSEASTTGSMILAAIIIKLASYGILRYNLYINYYIPDYIISMFITLILCSIIFSSIIPIRSILDFKKIIAYSSILHMNIALLGIFVSSYYGILGYILSIFTHAFISSTLFYLFGTLYTRYHTRILPYFSALIYYMPIYSGLLIMIIISNISIPFSISFISELLILISQNINYLYIVIIYIGIFLSTIYMLYLLNRILFGKSSIYIFKYQDITYTELFTIVPLFILIFISPYILKYIMSYFILSSILLY